jgi:predicted dienelactone hydrolase
MFEMALNLSTRSLVAASVLRATPLPKAQRRSTPLLEGRCHRPAVGQRLLNSLLGGLLVALFANSTTIFADESVSAYVAKGPHPVAVLREEWQDATRNRRVPVKIYYPADANAPSPVVIFSHGLGNSREGYEYLGQQWASHGFVSVHPEHVGAAHDIEKKGLIALYRAGNDRSYWRTFPEDIRFVIDHLPQSSIGKRVDMRRVAVAGHSLGAYATLAEAGLLVPNELSFRDARVIAGIPISMSEPFPRAAYRNINIPLLHITGTHDASIVYKTLPHDRRVPFESIGGRDQYLLTIAGANHSTYSDDEDAHNRRAHDLIRASTTAFLDAFLNGDAAARAWIATGGLQRFASEDATVEMRGVPGAAVRVGRIDVRSTPLFSATEESHGRFYQVADALHTPTRVGLVRKFLLFHEGEVYDPKRIAESEKNLRQLDFIKTATITPGAEHDGVVDIGVDTQDEWTTDPNVDFGHTGGVGTWSLNVTQKDLRGTGAEIAVTAARDPERTSRSLELIHPAFLRAYTNLDVLLMKASDGGEVRLDVGQPFFSTTTPWSYDLTFDHGGRSQRLFEGGVEISLFHQNYRDLRAMFGTALAISDTRAHRLLFGTELQDSEFSILEGMDRPENRHFRWALAGYEVAAQDLVKLDYVDHDSRFDDFELGPHARVMLGISPHGVTDRVTEEFIAQASTGFRLGDHALLLPRLSYSTRYAGSVENEIASAEARLLWRLATSVIQTFVTRLRVDDGHNLDRDVQFFADGLRGLRGYPAYALEGDRAVMFNAEHRVFLGRELLQLFAPAAAVFFDSGSAVTQGQQLRIRDFKSDFGVGLRVAIARAESTVLRLDIAYALNQTPTGKRGFVISFGTTQAF